MSCYWRTEHFTKLLLRRSSNPRSTLLRTLVSAMLLTGAVTAKAADCTNPSQWAYAQLSPARVMGSVEEAGSARLSVTFGKAYPVVEQALTYLEICLDGGRTVRLDSTAFLMVHRKNWVSLSLPAARSERSRLEFWESINGLSAYLKRGEEFHSPPSYREADAEYSQEEFRFPMLRSQPLATVFKGRVTEALNLLLPFSARAIEGYAQGRKSYLQPVSALGLVLDVSGSTNGFSNRFVQSVKQAIQITSDGRDIELAIVAFGGNGEVLDWTARRHSLPNERNWPALSSPDRRPPIHQLKKSFDTVYRAIPENSPVFFAAGGDVALNSITFPEKTRVLVTQITPEMEGALAKSAASQGLDFLEYADDPKARIATRLQRIVRHIKRQTSGQGVFTEVLAAQKQAGFISVLPVDIENTVALAIPPEKKVEWYAVPVWIVFRSDMMKRTTD